MKVIYDYIKYIESSTVWKELHTLSKYNLPRNLLLVQYYIISELYHVHSLKKNHFNRYRTSIWQAHFFILKQQILSKWEMKENFLGGKDSIMLMVRQTVSYPSEKEEVKNI